MIDFEQIEQEDRLWPCSEQNSEIEGSISDYWYYDEIADYPDQDEPDKDLNIEDDQMYNVSNACIWDGWNA
jgi:hypothetical protein